MKKYKRRRLTGAMLDSMRDAVESAERVDVDRITNNRHYKGRQVGSIVAQVRWDYLDALLRKHDALKERVRILEEVFEQRRYPYHPLESN